MSQELTPETQAVPDVDFMVAPADNTAAVVYEIALEARLMGTVAAYNSKRKAIGRANSDLKSIRATMTYEFALLKAVHVGRGRDGNWESRSKELKEKFGPSKRTVDRWIKNEVSQGQLPPWAADRLRANMDPDPAPKPEQPIFEMTFVFASMKERNKVAEHCQRLSENRLRQLFFDFITQHEETQPNYVKPKVKTFTDDESIPVGPETTIVGQMKQQAAGVAA